MKELTKKYNFKDTEKKWQNYWVDNKIFKFDWNDTKRENVYAIDTPPPHVSGVLHLGHIFGFSQMDCIARFHRMRGMNIFHPIGYDDNGLPSERYVEKKLGIKSKEMDRQEFVKICDKEIVDAEKLIGDLFKRAGYSFDWDEKYRTISDMSRRVSQMSFMDLYEKGVLYQKEQPVIWDIIDQTALAQTEAEDREFDGEMNYLRFELVDKKNSQENNRFIKSNPTSNSPLEGELRKQACKGEADSVGGYKHLYSKETLKRAKELRQNTTDAEGLLWWYLKGKQLGFKFRRQQPIDKYIVDFICLEKKLIIELDGGHHNDDKSIKYDNERSKFLKNQGFNIIRIWNNELFTNTDGILETIWNFLHKGIMPLTESALDSVLASSTLPQGESERRIPLEIMTTRPELLPACVSVMYHPEDKEKYEGKNAITPLGVEVPMVADYKVNKEKGTGVVMCCTFGDQSDVEWWKTYKLDLRIILDEKGLITFKNIKNLKFINEKYKKELEGLFVTKARKKILELLKEDGKLMREPVKIKHSVKTGERSKFPLEILVKKQWLIKVLDIKEELHEKAKEINWHPKWMEARIHSWIDGLNWDWCITRQRFFGVPVPVWYSKRVGEEGKVLFPAQDQLPVDPTSDLPKGYTRDEVIGETDIFDTWATSAVSPQLSIQGVTEDLCYDKERFNQLKLPFALRAQGHDIIRTWAFCTIVKAHYHQNTIPWKDIMVNGWCLAPDGTKMSKSKGNVINPIKIMDEYGTDAIRYWTSTSNLGTDTSFSEDIIKTGRKLVTKLFNASKFASFHFNNLAEKIETAKADIESGKIFETADLWLISKLRKTIESTTKAFEEYQYAKARENIENFFWNDFCDNYLEIAKVRCYGADGLKYQDTQLSEDERWKIDQAQQSGIRTIHYVLNAILKLFAPFVPHVTEEIFSCIYEDEFNKTKSIHSRGMWAKAEDFVANEKVEIEGELAVKVIAEVRKYKSDNNVSMKEELERITISYENEKILEGIIRDLKEVCNVKEVVVIKDGEFKIKMK